MRWNLRDWLTGGKEKTLEELHGGYAPGVSRVGGWKVQWTPPPKPASPTPPSGGSGVPATPPERRKGTVEAMSELLNQITNAVRGLTDSNNSAAEKRDVELCVQIVAVQTRLDALAKQLDAILVNQANLAAHVGMGMGAVAVEKSAAKL